MECLYGGEHPDQRKVQGRRYTAKTYCTDYIQKTFVENDGSEIPKYYAQNSHPAIVSSEEFDLTQMELEWRKSLHGSYSGKKLLCLPSCVWRLWRFLWQQGVAQHGCIPTCRLAL